MVVCRVTYLVVIIIEHLWLLSSLSLDFSIEFYYEKDDDGGGNTNSHFKVLFNVQLETGMMNLKIQLTYIYYVYRCSIVGIVEEFFV